jgi:hypothetical protein
MAHRDLSVEMRACIEACLACHQACVEAVAHCLQPAGKSSNAEHAHLLLDCAQICATSADFMSRGSPLHPRTCSVCAEVCDQCARACEAMGDAAMKACAQSCWRCAELCGRMSGVSAAA